MNIVVLETTLGIIKLKLFTNIAPKACFNFMALVEKGSYNNTEFSRVIPTFMIQGGKITKVKSIFGREFEDEISKSVNFARPGVLAMANRGKNTNTTQFFITTKPTEWLTGKHTIFGEVFGGYDTVEKISKVKRDKINKPIEPVKIIKGYINYNVL